MIKTQLLLRLSGLAALLGGALRIAVVTDLPFGPQALEALYDVIDVLLLMGLIGIYLARAEALGFAGMCAFAVALAAFSFIGGPDADVFDFSTYQEGSTVLALAMAALSIAWIAQRQKPFSAPMLWFASVVVAGILRMSESVAGYGMLAAGILFGLGFVSAGLDLVRRKL